MVRGHCFSFAHAAPLELPKGRAAGISRRYPLHRASAVEDVHWADPATLDVLRGITERGALPHCLPSRPPGPSFDRRGARARITVQFR